jgi:hypothetical protein
MSYSKCFKLSFSQCKEIINNGDNLRDFLESVTTNQPEFIISMGAIDSIYELKAIKEGGCESGAYMPAVTYSTALKCMYEHYEEIEAIFQDHGYESIEFDLESETFAGFSSRLVSMAVELWVSSIETDHISYE